MTKHRTTAHTGLWSRTTQTLGKFLAGMVTLPERPTNAAEKSKWDAYPRFPAF